jgi:hypothetical protein
MVESEEPLILSSLRKLNSILSTPSELSDLSIAGFILAVTDATLEAIHDPLVAA